jgi:hypothetical protein
VPAAGREERQLFGKLWPIATEVGVVVGDEHVATTEVVRQVSGVFSDRAALFVEDRVHRVVLNEPSAAVGLVDVVADAARGIASSEVRTLLFEARIAPVRVETEYFRHARRVHDLLGEPRQPDDQVTDRRRAPDRGLAAGQRAEPVERVGCEAGVARDDVGEDAHATQSAARPYASSSGPTP